MKLFRRVFLFLLAFCLLSACRKTSPADFAVVFFDVGQGNAALLQTESGNILVDCGPESAQESLCRKLKANGVKTLQCFILTHPDEDHIGGADVVLSQFPVDCILFNGEADQTESYIRMCEAISQSGVKATPVEAGNAVKLGDLQICFYAPLPQTGAGTGNARSLAFRVQHQGASVLFMGDAEEKTEEAMLSAFSAEQLKSTVLHVGHHGSETSTRADFLKIVQPSYAVISCGQGNRYGHPDGRVLERLRQNEVPYFRTDQCGDITFVWRGEALSIITEKEGKQ